MKLKSAELSFQWKNLLKPKEGGNFINIYEKEHKIENEIIQKGF